MEVSSSARRIFAMNVLMLGTLNIFQRHGFLLTRNATIIGSTL
jgi:hypothetical protein